MYTERKSLEEAEPLKTNLVIQQAMISAGLVEQDRADRVNIILQEQKRQEAKRKKRQQQAKQATLAHKRWYGNAS